ncbi:prolyl oligopeptidase family serine peptidase [Dactylosporangium vinaceum]|uniref:Alpha/beta hydrolase family protein n=1 Tax=Dactylosporangium vinaceum TaxID=53362 RepID=A0ABV5M1B0_9ACTN|nr:prolyl oligopeptidase family serine peptidase [Dactylosporangium vinaceum]UAB97168.1 prolyl oligopeptidase family serine peptidase [Dactylosporangium vinaceum]
MTAQAAPAPRKWPRRAAYAGLAGAAGLAVLLPTGTAGAGWLLAGQVLDVRGPRVYPVRVRARAGNRITLTRTPDTTRDIPLSFVWATGHARLGTVLSVDRATVTREVAEVTRGALVTGLRGYTSGYVFEGDPLSARGLPFEEVQVQGELGALPAWLVPGTTPPDDTWIIAVHGRGAPRGEALRALPTLAASGHRTLVVSYRNDQDAPPSADHRFHLGHTEWRDVQSAIDYARTNGARDVILMGWSMGGAAILNLLREWDHEGFLRALILDCPVVDWNATLHMNARQLNVPPIWTWTALKLIQHRLGVHTTDLDYRSLAERIDVPTLLYVDHDDRTVAPAPTVEFAHAAAAHVQLVETREAGHCRSWNLDPDAYERRLGDFLKSV